MSREELAALIRDTLGIGVPEVKVETILLAADAYAARVAQDGAA